MTRTYRRIFERPIRIFVWFHSRLASSIRTSVTLLLLPIPCQYEIRILLLIRCRCFRVVPESYAPIDIKGVATL